MRVKKRTSMLIFLAVFLLMGVIGVIWRQGQMKRKMQADYQVLCELEVADVISDISVSGHGYKIRLKQYGTLPYFNPVNEVKPRFFGFVQVGDSLFCEKKDCAIYIRKKDGAEQIYPIKAY